MAENVVMRQRQERRRQDVRGEQRLRENAAPARLHDSFSIPVMGFRRVQGFNGFRGFRGFIGFTGSFGSRFIC
jgi:hypothetical protein